MKVTFRLVRIGEMFNCNDNTYIKKSSRTGLMVSAPHTFYFSQTDLCVI
jgi:hypothetical protein